MKIEIPNRENETDEVRRKRLIYQANYRGFKEADLLLGGFAKAYMGELSGDEVDQFEALLSARDHDIYDWIAGRTAVPADFDTPILARLRSFDPRPPKI